jgi:hypothetical protein
MKKKILLGSIIILVCFVFLMAEIRTNGHADTPQRLTYTSAASQQAVQAYDGSNDFYVAWREDKYVHFRRNTNNGVSGYWNATQTVVGNGELDTAENPVDIAAVGSYVYLVFSWRPDASADYEIWLIRSTNNGTTWLTAQQISNNAANSTRPTIACSGQYVYVAWQDYSPGNWEILYRRSTDYGANWGTEVRLTYNTGVSDMPDMAAADNEVYLVWRDNTPGNYEIQFKGSGNYGSTFGGPWRLTYNPGNSWYPRVACTSTGQYVYVAWSDNNPGNYEIFFKRNTTYGTSGGWSGPTRICYSTNAGSVSWYPDIDCTDGGYVDIVWSDNNCGNSEIYGKYSVGTYGLSFGSVHRWTYNAGVSDCPKINSVLYKGLWQDSNPGNYEIFLK